MRTVYEFSVKDRKGKDVSLKEYCFRTESRKGRFPQGVCQRGAAHRQHSHEVWLHPTV